jgi:succinate dehydrogenase / fumarate reductase membrane anchor subunit
VAFIVIVVAVMGRNHAATVQILGSPIVAVIMLLFVLNMTYHMWLGMQVIVEDYIHHELGKILLLMANTFFCITIGLASAYALLKLSFGV